MHIGNKQEGFIGRVCISAINKKDSLAGLAAKRIAGNMAPRIFPKWGVPVLCIPVKMRDIALILFKISHFGAFLSGSRSLLIVNFEACSKLRVCSV
jgi:hypothetical protein